RACRLTFDNDNVTLAYKALRQTAQMAQTYDHTCISIHPTTLKLLDSSQQRTLHYAPRRGSDVLHALFYKLDGSPSAARSSSATRASISSSSIALAEWHNTLAAARTL